MHKVTAILEIISSISSTLALDEILAECTEKIAPIFEADSCAISSWDREDETLTALADYISPAANDLSVEIIDDVGVAYPLADYPASMDVLRTQTPRFISTDDPTADKSERELLQRFDWRSVLMVPMQCKGQVIGLLELYSDSKTWGQFSDDDLALCQALANQAAVAIENARLYREAEERRLRAEALQIISRVLSSELDYQRTAQNVANFALRLVDAQFVFIARPEAGGFQPIALAGSGPENRPTASSANHLSPLPGQSLLSQALKGPLVIPDLQQDPRFAPYQEAVAAFGWRTMVAVPLSSYDQVWAVLAAYADYPNAFDPDDVAILMTLASQAAVALQNAQLFEALDAQREAVHQISLRLVNAQEEERRRISRELHDELGQALTALKINLDVGRQALPSDASSKLRKSIDEAGSLAKRTMETARNLSLELHPAILDDLGLISALRWEIDRYEQRTGQTIHFKVEPAGLKLPPELEITVYRVVIEALTNVARHAEASQISIALLKDDTHIVARIQDDGVGFKAAARLETPGQRRSLGLISMRERAGLLGGRLEVRSKPGQGTTVQMRLPINR